MLRHIVDAKLIPPALRRRLPDHNHNGPRGFAPSGDRDLLGVCTLLKLGRSLAVGEVSLYSVGIEEVVAHAVKTYAIASRS